MIYKTEAEVYDRLQDLQGTHIPSLLAHVEVLDYYASQHVFLPTPTTSDLFSTPDLLLQHIPNAVPLKSLYTTLTPPSVPRVAWQYTVEEAVDIINPIMQHGIRNNDIHPRNALVFHSGFHNKYKVVMIDFGGCDLRTTESEREWREAEAYEDQEGAIGRLMECLLTRHCGGGYVYQATAFTKQLEYVYLEECGARI